MAVRVQAGPLSAEYQDGSLRSIRFGAREVLRQVYVAVRDQHWQTIPARLSGETVENHAHHFRIQFDAEHRTGEIDFAWRGTITGETDGSIRWSMSGEPRQSFLRNRIGFCVLHPIDGCAGYPCLVEHTDGSLDETAFPRNISPYQPFLQMQALSHEVAPGILAEVRFSGDVFETEDHRNWTDDSFKTYSTPLALLYPVRVGPGDRVEQAVALTLARTDRRRACINIDRTSLKPMPVLHFVRVNLHFAEPGWHEELSKAAQEIALFTDHPEQDLSGLTLPESVQRCLIFTVDGTVTRPEAVACAKRILGARIQIGGGSNTNFAELNRNRDIVKALDFVSWAIHPQRHAADEETTIENLAAQRHTVETARTFAGEKSLSVSPVHVPPIAAADSWIAASINQLGSAGVASITYDKPSSLFTEIRQFAPDRIASAESSHPLRVAALALLARGRMRVWLANLREDTVDVQLENQRFCLGPHELRSVALEGG